MPKPRTAAREHRRLGRQTATRDALAAISALAPSPALPPDALAGYREQVRHMRMWFSRAHRLSALLGDTPAADEPS